jgi:hypothetical protein
MKHNKSIEGGRNEAIASLVEQEKYFGANGALAYFPKNVRDQIKNELSHGGHNSSIQYLKVLCSVMATALNGSVFKKFRIYGLLVPETKWSFLQRMELFRCVIRANKIANSVRSLGIAFTVEDHYTLMLVAAQSLQIMKRLYLFSFMPETVEALEQDVLVAYKAIEKIASKSEKVKKFLLPIHPEDTEPMLLLAGVLLHVIGHEGIYPDKGFDFVRIEDSALRYIRYHKEATSYERIQFVSRLLHVMGHHASAAGVQKRVKSFS